MKVRYRKPSRKNGKKLRIGRTSGCGWCGHSAPAG